MSVSTSLATPVNATPVNDTPVNDTPVIDDTEATSTDMFVIKRSGEKEVVVFDKILSRIKHLTMSSLAVDKRMFPFPALPAVNCHQLSLKIIAQMSDDMSTAQIDLMSAQQCVALITTSLDYGTLAARVLVSNHQKNTGPSFMEVTSKLYNNTVRGKSYPLVSQKYYEDVQWIHEHGSANDYADVYTAGSRTTYTVPETTSVLPWNAAPLESLTRITFTSLDDVCQHQRDFEFDYFGFKTLEKAYLLEVGNEYVERPQHMWLRVAIGMHGRDIPRVLETYHYMSTKMFTHATPTLYNAGTNYPQLSSCFLLQIESDSIQGIYNTISDCAKISRHAGGIGVALSTVRAAGSDIRGTGGRSNGLVPMCRVFETTARYVDQGGGKRNGSFAMYLEPWHADVFAFIDLGQNHGAEKLRAKDLFYALWIPDLFMRRVRDDQKWTLMCPNTCPDLTKVYGETFDALYETYEAEGRGVRTIQARDLWFHILKIQMETSRPYLLYKDAVNRCSNQANLGTVQCSNLCAEITQFTSDKESAVCNLASIALPSFFDSATGQYDYAKLAHVAGVVAENLDTVIDINYNPTEKTLLSNHSHRPIGIGVQGLADVFAMHMVSFESPEAAVINRNIFEAIYWGALNRSADMAVRKGVYSSFRGSPASEGKLQFDLHGKTVEVEESNRYDWAGLRAKIMHTGLRNSLLVALMPTATTAQILGFNECFEPFTSNLYTRRTNAGDFTIINQHMVKMMSKLGLWSAEMAVDIVLNKGSIQHLTQIPRLEREVFKTAWEISMRSVINMAADRAPFVCQSQSMNLWMAKPDYAKLTTMHMLAWTKGLKTGMYYLRNDQKYSAQQFAVDPSIANAAKAPDGSEPEEEMECAACSA